MLDKIKAKFKEHKDEIITGGIVAAGAYVAYQVVQPIVSIFGSALVFLGIAYLAYRKRDKIRKYINKFSG